jgi:hypothetical protein
MKKTAWHKAAHDLGIGPAEADNYLNTLNPTDQHNIQQAKRKDNPKLTPHLPGLKAAHTPTKRTYRRSLGNPTKTPRAGAPNLNGTFNLEHLIAIKELATQQGGLDTLQHNLDALRTITSTT